MKIRVVLATVAAVALAAAGVAAAAAVTRQGSAVSGTVNLHKTKLGKVLAGKTGKTLYLFMADKNGKSACYGKCATNWPPLKAEAGAKADDEWTIVDRTDGTKMWAYDGKPVYTFIKDKKAGDMTGDGVGEVWHIVKAD